MYTPYLLKYFITYLRFVLLFLRIIIHKTADDEILILMHPYDIFMILDG